VSLLLHHADTHASAADTWHRKGSPQDGKLVKLLTALNGELQYRASATLDDDLKHEMLLKLRKALEALKQHIDDFIVKKYKYGELLQISSAISG
jgi:hypothetical protein